MYFNLTSLCTEDQIPSIIHFYLRVLKKTYSGTTQVLETNTKRTRHNNSFFLVSVNL